MWELRSNVTGQFDITDRTGSATRLLLDTNGNMCVGTSSLNGTTNGIIMANGTGPSVIPFGGCLYVNGGALWFKGGAGTVTKIANA